MIRPQNSSFHRFLLILSFLCNSRIRFKASWSKLEKLLKFLFTFNVVHNLQIESLVSVKMNIFPASRNIFRAILHQMEVLSSHKMKIGPVVTFSTNCTQVARKEAQPQKYDPKKIRNVRGCVSMDQKASTEANQYDTNACPCTASESPNLI